MGRKGDGSTLARVRSVSRAFAILRAFHGDEPQLLLKTIAERARLDHATTRRLLVTMMDEGLIAHNGDTARYRLTTGLTLLASAVHADLTVTEFSKEHLLRLAEKTRTTVFLSAYLDQKMICLSKFNLSNAVDIKWWGINESLPLNCGAAPKLILAHLPADEAQSIFKLENFVALTPHSVMDPDQLRSQLEEARRDGWLLSKDDVSDGLSALAAPILSRDGSLIAAVSMGGLTPQITAGAERPDLVEPLLKCADAITDFVQSFNGEIALQ